MVFGALCYSQWAPRVRGVTSVIIPNAYIFKQRYELTMAKCKLYQQIESVIFDKRL